MKRIFSILLVLCLVFGMTIPAFAADIDSHPDITVGTSGEDELASETTAEQPTEPSAEPETPPYTIEEIPAEPSPEDSDTATPTDSTSPPSLGESCEAQSIMPLSGFEGENAEFFTRIRLTVTDRGGNPVAGAVYGLYRTSDNSLVEYLTTDSFGIAVSSDVPIDTDYYLLEESAPEGYLPNDGRKDIILTEVCAPSRVDVTAVYDSITGYIKIIKIDEDGNPLEGAGFYIYRQSPWSTVESLITGPDGTATSGELRYGQYEIYEYSVPGGYSGAGWEYVFISEHGKTEEITIVNYKASGSVRIYKTGSDERKIQGAVFSVYDADTDEWLEDITTGSGGYAYSSSLLLGDYYAVEKSVPAPYKLSNEKHYFTVSYNGETVYLNIENAVDGEFGKVKVIKTDDSGNPLVGVVFGIYRSWDNKKLSELTTSDDGTAESGLLIPGEYYLIELVGKSGYETISGQIPFTIYGDGATVELPVENPKIRIFGKIKVIKKDDAGNLLSGIRFGVYCKAGNLLEELVTGLDGTATSGILNEGEGYYLKELEGIAGYLEDVEAQHTFAITENNAVVSVTVTNPRISGAVKVIKDDGEGEPLPGVVFGIYKDGVKLQELTALEDGTAVSGTLYYGDYELRELATVDGYELIDTPIPFSITEDNVTLEIPVSNPLILGSVTVIKTEADQQPAETPADTPSPLAGAVFGIYNGQGQKTAELTIGDDGTATHTGLPKGDYLLKELKAPEGFVLTDAIFPFSIQTQAQNVEITVENTKGYGVVKVLKTGENNAPLSGVSFTVYRTADDEPVGELVTLADGTAEIELPLGRYYLMETVTNTGYKLLEGRISFTLTEDGATLELPIQNQKEDIPEGKVRLIKKTEDGKLLSGAVFGIYRADNNEKVGELVTGTNGEAMSSALPVLEKGYYLLEITPPTGYKLSDQKTPIMIADGETAVITVTNKPVDPETPKSGNLLIVKKSEDGALLKGAVFGIYEKATDKKVAEITTDRYGEASISLPAGDYYLRELEAPSGYKLDSGRISFTIKSAEVKEITVKNKADTSETKPGKLLLIKKSEDGKPLRGAVFGIYNANTDKKVTEITTDRYGEAIIELSEGDYYLRELEAPVGYKLDATRIPVRIKSGQTKEQTVTNKADTSDTGKLLLIKKSEDGKLLYGAVFGIYEKATDKKVAEITTDRFGEAAISLPAGDYYLRELEAPEGYALSADRIVIKITAGKTSETTVINKLLEPEKPAPTGTLLLIKKAEGSGKRLPGAVFGIYEQSTNKLVSEITTGENGEATASLPAGNYYLLEHKAPNGYTLEKSKIPFSIKVNVTVKAEVTNMLYKDTPIPGISIPKTGEAFPTLNYALAAVMFGIVALCGVIIVKDSKRKTAV